jgi:hypothetical protein
MCGMCTHANAAVALDMSCAVVHAHSTITGARQINSVSAERLLRYYNPVYIPVWPQHCPTSFTSNTFSVCVVCIRHLGTDVNWPGANTSHTNKPVSSELLSSILRTQIGPIHISCTQTHRPSSLHDKAFTHPLCACTCINRVQTDTHSPLVHRFVADTRSPDRRVRNNAVEHLWMTPVPVDDLG